MPGHGVAGIEVIVWLISVRSMSVQLDVSMPVALIARWSSR